MFKQYAGVKKYYSIYWKEYGGWRAIALSPYFHVACVLTALTYIFPWGTPSRFSESALNILPDIFGFTLAGYTLMFTFGDRSFLFLLAGKTEEGKVSLLVRQAANYMHFLMVQGVTLVYSAFVSSFECQHELFNFFGYLLFYYSLMLVFSTVVHVFKSACRFDKFLGIEQSRNKLTDQEK